jgi:hypothetical protein
MSAVPKNLGSFIFFAAIERFIECKRLLACQKTAQGPCKVNAKDI